MKTATSSPHTKKSPGWFQNRLFVESIVRRMGLFIFGFLLMWLVAGCDLYEQDDYVEQYVIESFFTSDEPLAKIKLSTTVPFFETYRFEDVAVSGADVQVHLLDPDGSVETTYSYSESDLTRGHYFADDTTAVVKPLRMYKLEITNLAQENERITATTLVPPAIQLLEVNNTDLVYQGADQFEATFIPGNYPGRQSIFVASALALDPDNFPLTPFWDDQDSEEGEFVRVSSGIVNEGNYDTNPDGSLTLKYPWIGIAYFGPNELSIYTIDDNLYDYQRSVNIQGGGSTLSPGQIENVLWNVDGGIGVFASRSGISFEVFIDFPDLP